MIKHMLIASAALLCAPAVSFAQPDPTPPSQMAMSAPTAVDYMKKAAQSDHFEIQEGHLAAQKASSADVKKFANQMVRDHTKSSQMIMAAAMKSSIPAPSGQASLDADQQQMLTSLQGMSGPDFDKAYISQQMTAHQMALSLHQSYASSGTDPNLREAAQKIVPVVQSHITMLQSMPTM